MKGRWKEKKKGRKGGREKEKKRGREGRKKKRLKVYITLFMSQFTCTTNTQINDVYSPINRNFTLESFFHYSLLKLNCVLSSLW